MQMKILLLFSHLKKNSFYGSKGLIKKKDETFGLF